MRSASRTCAIYRFAYVLKVATCAARGFLITVASPKGPLRKTLPKPQLSWPLNAPPKLSSLLPRAKAKVRARGKARAATKDEVAVEARRMHLHPVNPLAKRRLLLHPAINVLRLQGDGGRQLLLHLLRLLLPEAVLGKNQDAPGA